jgi:hypothetical protein
VILPHGSSPPRKNLQCSEQRLTEGPRAEMYDWKGMCLICGHLTGLIALARPCGQGPRKLGNAVLKTPVLWIFFFFFFGSTGVWTQGLTLGRQALLPAPVLWLLVLSTFHDQFSLVIVNLPLIKKKKKLLNVVTWTDQRTKPLKSPLKCHNFYRKKKTKTLVRLCKK